MLTRRLRTGVSVASWVAIPVTVVAVIVLPELRPAVVTYLSNVWLLLVLFWLTRPKTVSWRLVSAVFTVGLPWGLATGLLSRAGAGWVGLQPGTAGPSAGLASTVEETLKLLPLLVIAVFAAGRARRFAAVDWAVLAFTCGLAFNAVEDSAREVYRAVTPPSLLEVLFGGDPGLAYSSNPWTSARFESSDGVAVAAGHPVWSMLVGACVGLGFAMWRAGAASTGRWSPAWQVGGVVLPLWALAWVITDHAAYNAWASSPGFTEGVAGSGFPWLAAVAWVATGKGAVTGTVCVGAYVACWLVDAHRRGVAARRSGDAGTRDVRCDVAPVWVADPEATVQRWWARAGDRVRGAALRAAVLLVARALVQAARDAAVIVLAHVRVFGEPRVVALRRGRAAMAMTRDDRAVAMGATTPGREPTARRRFAITVGTLGTLVVAGWVVVGLVVASRIGAGLPLHGDQGELFTFGVTDDFANLLDRLGTWWDGLGPWGQIAVTAVAVAGILLLGGGLGTALFATGIATYGLSHAHGLADLTRNPGAAVRDYAAHATPVGAVADLGGFGLTFIPGSALGVGGARATRAVAGSTTRWVERRLITEVAAHVDDPAPLLRELAENGVKHTPEDVLRVARAPDGTVVFLEAGTQRSGLLHIVTEHGGQFADIGVATEEIPDVVIKAVTHGEIVGIQGTRTVYLVEHGGQKLPIAVQVADNGYIVGANPNTKWKP